MRVVGVFFVVVFVFSRFLFRQGLGELDDGVGLPPPPLQFVGFVCLFTYLFCSFSFFPPKSCFLFVVTSGSSLGLLQPPVFCELFPAR